VKQAAKSAARCTTKRANQVGWGVRQDPVYQGNGEGDSHGPQKEQKTLQQEERVVLLVAAHILADWYLQWISPLLIEPEIQILRGKILHHRKLAFRWDKPSVLDEMSQTRMTNLHCDDAGSKSSEEKKQ
jgi:hypothetical protein